MLCLFSLLYKYVLVLEVFNYTYSLSNKTEMFSFFPHTFHYFYYKRKKIVLKLLEKGNWVSAITFRLCGWTKKKIKKLKMLNKSKNFGKKEKI